jgi:hypothetical protein
MPVHAPGAATDLPSGVQRPSSTEQRPAEEHMTETQDVIDRPVETTPHDDDRPASAPGWHTMHRTLTRSGRGALERKALYAVQREMEALSAAVLVQLLLWPETISAWAERSHIKPSVAYNMLAGVKSYHDARSKLAERLGVTKPDLDYLIDARRPLPTSQRLPLPPDGWVPERPSSDPAPTPAEAHEDSRELHDEQGALPL